MEALVGKVKREEEGSRKVGRQEEMKRGREEERKRGREGGRQE